MCSLFLMSLSLTIHDSKASELPLVSGFYITPALGVDELSRSGSLAPLSQDSTSIIYDVRVLLAADDEMASRQWSLWNESVTWEMYAGEVLGYTSWELTGRFSVALHPLVWTTYESDDEFGVSYALLIDAINKLHFKTPVLYEGVWVDMLVVFSDSKYTSFRTAGVATNGTFNGQPCAACLIKPQHDWADPALLQHEISHFYGALDHFTPEDPNYYADCIMSYRPVYVGTIFKYGYDITINNVTEICYICNDYCSTCQPVIDSNKAKYGIPEHNIPQEDRRGGGSGTGGGGAFLRPMCVL